MTLKSHSASYYPNTRHGTGWWTISGSLGNTQESPEFCSMSLFSDFFFKFLSVSTKLRPEETQRDFLFNFFTREV